MSFIKYDNFRGEYKLSVQSIDEMAAKVEDFLYSLGTERANVLGIRLSIEEALLRWYDHFKAKGEEPKVRFYTGKSFFRPVINITLKGESIDPFDGTDDENSSGDWVGTMMANIGLSPRYTYENGINILHLRLSRPQINPGIGLLIGIAAGIIIGLSTRFLLGEADIEMLTNSFFMPVQSVFFRLLQATAGPVIFFTVLTATAKLSAPVASSPTPSRAVRTCALRQGRSSSKTPRAPDTSASARMTHQGRMPKRRASRAMRALNRASASTATPSAASRTLRLSTGRSSSRIPSTTERTPSSRSY